MDWLVHWFSRLDQKKKLVTIQVLREDNGADGCTHGCIQTELAEGLSRLERFWKKPLDSKAGAL